MINISVIIPHYNSVNYLVKLIRTVPDREDIEVIIIDDNSTEGVEELSKLIVKYGRANLYLLKNKTGKKGAGTCRNIGLKNAKGKWVVFADSDDFFTDNAFSFYDTKIDSTADVIYSYSRSEILGTGEISDRGDEYKKNIKAYIEEPSLENKYYILFGMNSPCLKLIRSEFLNKNHIMFDETMVSNDVMFSTKVGYYAGNIEICDECTYCITKSERGTLTTTYNLNELMTRVEVFVNWYVFLSSVEGKNYCPKYYISFPGIKYIKRAICEKYGITTVLKIIMIYRRNHIKWWCVHPTKILRIIRKRVVSR